MLPFSDNICSTEPCGNHERCDALLKFVRRGSVQTRDRGQQVIFSGIIATPFHRCSCPIGYTGLVRLKSHSNRMLIYLQISRGLRFYHCEPPLFPTINLDPRIFRRQRRCAGLRYWNRPLLFGSLLQLRKMY